jgi:hypothetical protein
MRDPLHVGGTHSSQHILPIEAMSTALENASDRVRLLTDKDSREYAQAIGDLELILASLHEALTFGWIN